MRKIKLIVASFLVSSIPILAHPGKTDSKGGHYDKKSGSYHYHGGGSSEGQGYRNNNSRTSFQSPQGTVVIAPKLQLTPRIASPKANPQSNAEDLILKGQIKRAEEGDPISQYQLGERYLKGDKVAKNVDEAKVWFEKSAAGGNGWAAKKLASLTNSVQSASLPSEKEITPPLDLISDAELCLRNGKFEEAAGVLNKILMQKQQSGEVQLVNELVHLLREKENIKVGPITSKETERIRSMMDSIAEIKRGYKTTTPEKREALEVIFGIHTFRTPGNGLRDVVLSMNKLSNSREKTLKGQ